jgi:hypothetical protein
MNSYPLLDNSQKVFVRLLRLYPREYREAFGPPMAQLFKDCSREALSTRGTIGLITLWLATLPDLFKTALEETFKEITHMSKEKFFRMGRWAFLLGAVLFLLMFVVGSLETSTYDPLGGPDALIEYLKLGIGPLALGLLFIGVVAIRSAYGDAAGPSAKAALLASALGSLLAVVGTLGMQLSVGLSWAGEIWWYLFFGGAMLTLLGIGVFGLACLQRKLLPGIAWLFALGGLILPLISLAQIVYQLATDAQANPSPLASALAIGLTTTALLAAGLQLHGVEPQAKKAR